MILLLPTIPVMSRVRHSHHTGLKLNIMENASKAPFIAPAAAAWVLILTQLLITAQTTSTARAQTRMLIMKWGMWRLSINTRQQA